MPRNISISRRAFTQALAAGALGGPTTLHSAARAAAYHSPNDRIQIGLIGVGTMGHYHLKKLLGQPDVQVVGVCDVVAERREHARTTANEPFSAQTGKGSIAACEAYQDSRELLAQDGIDAVLIATPDHWHAIPAILAARAGKDIYCEKPLAVCIDQGRAMVEAMRAHQVVFQTGSQQRTEFGGLFRDACELVRNGRIGQVKTIRVGVGPPPVPCDLPEEPVPEGTDWNLWLGPAPWRGYNEVLCPQGVHHHFPAWRNYREYAGGGLADMGAHHFDIAQWALDMDTSGPVRIEPPEGDAPTGLKFTYAGGVEMYHGGPRGCTFEGTEGTIYVDRGTLESTPPVIVAEPLAEGALRLPRADDHHRNWLECIRSRKPPICDVETGHRSATICHLANIGYQLRRPLNWDPEQERFDDNEANALVNRELRAPWSL